MTSVRRLDEAVRMLRIVAADVRSAEWDDTSLYDMRAIRSAVESVEGAADVLERVSRCPSESRS